MKCELAAALLHRPGVLFLDEPTIGLDVVMQEVVRDFIRVYNERWGATILLTSHYMDDVRELCERVIIIAQGRLLYDGSLAAIIAEHAPHRVLTVVFDRPVVAARLAEFGEVVRAEPLQATLHVPRAEVSARAAALLTALPVADIAITDAEIDEVIRRIFGAAEARR
jgi:ABC-2 type transport system ATP-binding protein